MKDEPVLLKKEDIERQFRETQPKYERLGRNVCEALQSFLEEKNINALSISYRVKTFNSFWEKIGRKGYKNPFEQTEDFCGVRVICFYVSDLDKIVDIIKTEFNVKEAVDKTELMDTDRFGYRSYHFIVTLKDKWLLAPGYRGLENFKAEIQVRTILMHAWSDCAHKLAYKKKEHIPNKFMRKLSLLSAMFELADEQFETLKNDREQYMNLMTKEAEKAGKFDVNIDMNLDNLQAFLDYYFPDRMKLLDFTLDLLEELMSLRISFKDLEEAYLKINQLLPRIEADEIHRMATKGQSVSSSKLWGQVGAVRWMLDLTNDKYWQYRVEFNPSLQEPGNPVNTLRAELKKASETK